MNLGWSDLGIAMALVFLIFLYLYLTRRNRWFLEVSNPKHALLWEKSGSAYILRLGRKVYILDFIEDSVTSKWQYTALRNFKIFLCYYYGGMKIAAGDPRLGQLYNTVASRVEKKRNKPATDEEAAILASLFKGMSVEQREDN